MIQVDLKSHAGTIISFNTGVADANGVLWWVTDLEGWDLPNTRQKMIPKVQEDGSVVGESFFGDRAITIGGIVQAPTTALWWSSQYALKALLAADISGGVNFTQIIVHEETGVLDTTSTQRYASVKLAGSPKFKLFPGSWQFAIPLTAPDPHLYLMDGSDAGVGVL